MNYSIRHLANGDFEVVYPHQNAINNTLLLKKQNERILAQKAERKSFFYKVAFTLLILLSNSCSYVHYVGRADASTELYAFSVGSIGALEGAEFTATKDARSLKVDKVNRDQAQGISKFTTLFTSLLTGLVKFFI